MPLYRDRVRETSTTTGTGALDLGGAVTGFQSFAGAFDDGDTTVICIALRNGAEWEVVEGVYDLASNTVSRDTVIDSSDGPGLLVDFSGGTKDVYCVLDSETINGMFAGTGITELTGDVLAGPGSSSQVATLSPTGVVAGIYLNATIEVDTSGRILNAADGVGGGGASVTVDTVAPGSPSEGDLWWKSDEGTLKIYFDSAWIDAVAITGAGAGVAHIVNGRLTLTTGVPVTTADVTGATTIYLTPFGGNVVTLFDGTLWSQFTFTEKSLALGTLTSGKPYDVFGYISSGTLALELLAWTSDTARATAVTLQDGRYCKSGDKTRLLLGTIYTTSTTTTEDSAANRYVSNVYNSVEKPLLVTPFYNNNNAANTTTTSSTTFTALNAGSGDTASFVNTTARSIAAGVAGRLTNSGSADCYLGISYDAGDVSILFAASSSIGYIIMNRGIIPFATAEGRHSMQMKWAVSSGTGTYYADGGRLGGSAADNLLSGLQGLVRV